MLEVMRGKGLEPAGEAVPLEEVRLLAPIPAPPNIICIGLNYRDHAEESKMAIPDKPVVFAKFTNSIASPDDPVIIPTGTRKADYEAELVAVIGKETKDVAEDAALDHVFGYMNGNDISARDLQQGDAAGQWSVGKSPDTFGPIGPYLVTADEVGDPQDLSVRLIRNGEVVQDGHTRDMIFTVAEIVSHLSKTQTLVPGDIIMTGTPAGVILGYPEDERDWLKAGDEMTVEITGLGSLTNPVKAK